MLFVIFVVVPLASILFFLGWALIAWNRKRIREQKTVPLSREVMEKGFTPSGVAPWQTSAGFALIFFILGCSQLLDPSQPPFKGKWSLVNSVLYQNLGEYGIAAVSLMIATLMAVATFFSWPKDKLASR